MTIDDDELRELQDPDTWDWEHAEVRPPVESPGAVVAVRFSGEEFGVIARLAEHLGMTSVAFIREAALAKVEQHRGTDPFVTS